MKSLKEQKKNKVLVRKEKGKVRIRWVRDIVSKLLEIRGLEGIEISVYLTDDNTIKLLNKNFRGKDKATDVLSFTYNEQVGGYKLLGEIAISIDTAKRQAKELGHSLEEEIKRLLVHGFVHLLGYDHELGEEEEKQFMELEKRLIESLSSYL
ncbi:MAG: rRNA maturation RNase YbeY [Aquificaceae bacterium]